MRKLLLLITICAIGALTQAQTWNDTVTAIEKIFSRYKPASPGAQVAIARNGKIIFSKAWGMADMEHQSPLTTGSIIEAGSVSKQFTAAAILLLEQQGKLSLNDDVHKYVPELPDYGYTITLRHMMQHTSGLRDWGSIASLAGWPRGEKTYSNNDALYIISLQKTLNHKPGDEYIYSNSNYNLFAVIVERVSGMSLAEYTRKNIFEPAGMQHTAWRDNFRRIVRDRAIAYSKDGNGYYTNMPNENVYGNGGLLTTAEDLVTWNHYYTSGKFGAPALLQKQLALSLFNNGVKHNYAAGLMIRKYYQLDLISHDGATAGYRASLECLPQPGLSIAWLSNTSEFDRAPENVTEDIRKIFIQQPAAGINPPAAPVAYNVPKEKLNTYTGWYRNQRSNSGIRFFTEGEKLRATPAGPLTPLSDGIFMMGTGRFEFKDNKKMMFISAVNDSVLFTAVQPADITTAGMNEYTGSYYSDEVQAGYSVILKDGKLVLHQQPVTEFMLMPTFKDGFDSPIGSLYFERDAGNRIIHFAISTSRARNVAFKKISALPK